MKNEENESVVAEVAATALNRTELVERIHEEHGVWVRWLDRKDLIRILLGNREILEDDLSPIMERRKRLASYTASRIHHLGRESRGCANCPTSNCPDTVVLACYYLNVVRI